VNNYIYSEENCSYNLKKKFSSGNTVEIEFFICANSEDGPLIVEVCLRSYAKRKHKERIDFEFISTGRDALEPAIWATKCLLEFPVFLFSESFYRDRDQIVYEIYWSNARRRDVYHKWLSRYGFYFDRRFSGKCISKIYDRP
jgi:hypothetical protein